MKLHFLLASMLVATSIGCDEQQQHPAVETAANATATSEPSAKLSASVAAPLPLGKFCQQMCERSSSCGLETAAALAKTSGRPSDKRLLAEARQQQARKRDTCVANCNKAEVTEPQRDQYLHAQGCLQRNDCDAFSRCMYDTAQQPSQTP